MKALRIILILLLAISVSCTKLDESFRSEVEQSNAGALPAADLLRNAYNSLNGPLQFGDNWHLQEHASDEAIAPTRGPDWDDNGEWRQLHAHTWNADNSHILGAFRDLLSVQFAASQVLAFNVTPQQAAEARFIRALSIFYVVDLFGQVPYREDLNDYRIEPIVWQPQQAIDFMVAELNDVIDDLPETGPAYVANKNAVRVLLMKIYLNKGAWLNRAAPTFDPADMAQVISLADDITGTGRYGVNPGGYWANFAPSNDALSSENIFTLFNQNGDRGGNVRGAWFQVSHYNMDPGGWNGFATLSDFYDKFSPTDERIGTNYRYTGARPNPSGQRNVGFFVGQYFNETTGAPVNDRKGAPLIFTRDVQIRELDPNTLEATGIRVVKYPYDYGVEGDQKNNDWAVFRYSDVLLMKAEALLRTSQATPALTIVNSIRTARGVANFASLTEENLLEERGRELYWEGWRRQDLIRFGRFLEPWQEKAVSNPRNFLYPIPNNQLAVNSNLVQNPGYDN